MPDQQEFLFIDTTTSPAGTGSAGVPPADEGRPGPRSIQNPVSSEATGLTSKIQNLHTDTLIEEIRAIWRMPFLRQKVRVTLRGCNIDEMTGYLEIADPIPDYPFNPARPLHLRIGHITFTRNQITSCVLL